MQISNSLIYLKTENKLRSNIPICLHQINVELCRTMRRAYLTLQSSNTEMNIEWAGERKKEHQLSAYPFQAL